MTANKQQLNEVKTDALFVSSAWSRTPSSTPPVLQVGSATINPSSSVRSLGAIFDSHLRMEGQVRATAKRAFFHLHRISKISKHLTRPAIAQLIQAFVISSLDYNNALLFGLPAVTLDKLQRVQNAAARLLTGSRKRDHITPHLKALHWLPVNKRIDFKIALLSYKCRAKTAPGYLQELVTPYVPPRQLRSTASLDLTERRFKTDNYGRRAFSRAAPLVWNSLPNDVRSATSLSQFRSSLKTHLFRTAFVS